MATITGLTAERMLTIEGESVVNGAVVGSHLYLTKFNGGQIDAGVVVGPAGPTGEQGPPGLSAIPGEIKMWPGATLPNVTDYGLWVWADGAIYVAATYPIAASHIATAWKTFNGMADPGAGNFRVPDMRGLTPVGMDAMPGGSRANRMTRAAAIVLASKTGEETHIITLPEMAQHSHTVTDPGHNHGGYTNTPDISVTEYVPPGVGAGGSGTEGYGGHQTHRHAIPTGSTGITIQNAGSNNGHENIQPSVFVPYIVKLDD